MKLISATVRNYRIHRETTVLFDAQRSLIGGVNESGKSTLIEAIHRGLFLKSRVTGETQKSMVSHQHTGHPEVDIEFSVGDKTYRLSKRFSGQSGTTQLVEVGGNIWQGEEAETRLNTLLNVEELGSGRGLTERLMQQWAHLWVWQGKSGNDPTQDAASEHNAILQRLQDDGGAAIMQSDHDTQAARHFALQYEAIYTQHGKYKKGSEADNAERMCVEAENKESMCKLRMQRLEQAAMDFESSKQTIDHTENELIQLTQQKKQNENSREQANRLKNLRDQQAEAFSRAERQEKELKQTEQTIQHLRNEITQQTANLTTQRETLMQLKQKRDEQQNQVRTVSNDYQQAIEQTRTIRQQRDLAQLWMNWFKLQEQFEKLSVTVEKVSQQKIYIQQEQTALNTMPPIDKKALQTLHTVQDQLNLEQAALQAMAVGIEIIAAEHSIRIGHKEARAGEKFNLDEPIDIRLSDSTHLRIQPGGGGKLETTRQKIQELQNQLNKALDGFGIESVEQAALILTKREKIHQNIKNFESTLMALDDGTLDKEYHDVNTERANIDAEISRRTGQLSESPSPATRQEAADYLDRLHRELDIAEHNELNLKAQSNEKTALFNQTEANLLASTKDFEANEGQIAEKQANVKLLLEMHGDDAKRAAALQQAGIARQQAETSLVQTDKELENLQPEHLERDQNRIERALTELEKNRKTAWELNAVSQAALRLDGTDDPQAEWSVAHARLQNAQEQFQQARRKAEAVKLLNDLFQEQQQQLSDRFSQPLADKISSYLDGLFGAGTQVSITLDDGAFRNIRLIRPGESVPLSFDDLSGGTREQVAAAVRLAMAELLAANHDGKLPVVFDDAFAYSDPERVKTLQRMLDMAAENGLQIIILSCNPIDYASLGAKSIQLDKIV